MSLTQDSKTTSTLTQDSRTLGLGSELVTNGTFTGNANGWTLFAGWSYGGNKITAADGTMNLAYQDYLPTLGTSYRLEFDLSGSNASSLYIGINEQEIASLTPADGHYSYDFVADMDGINESYGVSFNSQGWAGSVDNVTLKEMVGSTITQDSKTSNTLTSDNRTAVGTMAQDSKTLTGNLWSATIYPWISTFFPWAWAGNGQIIIQDTRNV